MQAMTIIEHSKNATALTKAYIDIFAKESDILAAMPYKNVTGGAYPYNIEDMGGGFSWRGVNEGYDQSIGVENPQIESLSIAGGEMDVDIFLTTTQGEGRRAREEMKKLKAISRGVTNAIIYGDNRTDPRQFDGLQNRLRGQQVVDNAAGGAGGAALSLMALDDACSRVASPTHIIMPRRFRDVLIPAALRNQEISGNIEYKPDMWGRRMMYYNGLPMLVGYEVGPEDDILPFTETAVGGGAAQSCSIYVVSLKDGHLCGIQDSPIDVRDIGELETAPVKRTRMEWYNGMCIENPYSAARLTGVRNLPIVA